MVFCFKDISVKNFRAKVRFPAAEFVVPLVALLFYYAPFLFPETRFVPIHDVFDGHIPEDRAVRDFFLEGQTQAEFIAGGSTPVWAMSRFLQPLSVVPNLLLPVLPAYLAIDLIVRSVTYISFRILTKRLDIHPLWGVGTAIAIALGVTFSSYGFGIAGFGLLMAIALTKGEGRSTVGLGSAFALLLVGWNTSLTVHAPFIAAGFILSSLILNFDVQLKKLLKLSGIYIFGSILGNLNIIYAQFFSGVVWHRTEFECYWCTLDQTIQSALTGSGLLTPFYLAYTYHLSLPLTLLVALTLVVVTFSPIPPGDRRRIGKALILGLAFPFLAPFVRLIQGLEIFSFLPSFQFDRIAIWGHLFFVLAALLSLQQLGGSNLQRIGVIFLSLQLSFSLLLTPHIRGVYNHVLGDSVFQLAPAGKRYEEFLRERDYGHVRQRVGVDQVVSIGLDPAPAILNRIHSANGYLTLYPLSYKQQWLPVIENVIQGTVNENFYKKWGSVIYAFADQGSYQKLNFCSGAGKNVKFAVSGFPLDSDSFELTWASDSKDLFLYSIKSDCR